MIKATPVEIRAYCLSMVDLFILTEEKRKRQRIPVWANADEVAARIATGLQCTEQAAQSMVQDMINDGAAVVNRRMPGCWIRTAPYAERNKLKAGAA